MAHLNNNPPTYSLITPIPPCIDSMSFDVSDQPPIYDAFAESQYKRDIEFVTSSGMSLRYIKDQSAELCKIAVEQDPMAFKFVQDRYQTMDLCKTVIMKCPMCICYVSESLSDNEYTIIFKLALELDPIRVLLYDNKFWEKNRATHDQHHEFIMMHMSDFVRSNINSLNISTVSQLPINWIRKTIEISQLMRITQLKIDKLQTDGMNLEYMIDQTLGLCMIAIQNDPDSLKFVDAKIMSNHYEKIMRCAIRNNPHIIFDIDIDKITKGMAEDAVSRELPTWYGFPCYPKKDTETVYNRFGKPEEIHSYSLDEVKYNRFPISGLPNSLITLDICIKSVNANPDSIRNIPINRLTHEIYLHAFHKRSSLISQMPAEFQTKEICLIAIKNDPNNIIYIHKQTEELCTIAFMIKSISIAYVRDIEIIKFLLKIDGLALYYVYHEKKAATYEIAVEQNGLALKYVKDQIPIICEIAVKQNGLALQYVKNQTPRICEIAVNQNGMALQYVKNQTNAIRRSAHAQNTDSKQYSTKKCIVC